MTKKPVLFRRLRSAETPPEGVPDNAPVATCLTKVFHYRVGRNTWWGPGSTHLGDTSFSVDREVLERQIESERVQGSRFTLTELPAVALVGTDYDLLLVQPWGNSPFNNFRRASVNGTTLFEIAGSIDQREHYISTFIAPSGVSKLASLPFRTFDSAPQGAGWPLAWNKTGHTYDLAPILALIVEVTVLLNNRSS